MTQTLLRKPGRPSMWHSHRKKPDTRSRTSRSATREANRKKVGDWLNYGEGRPQWGDNYEQAISTFNREYKTALAPMSRVFARAITA